MITNPTCTLYLIRHGQSVANVNDKYGLDTKLTEEGKGQIEHLATVLRDIHFDAIYSSPMARSIQSAEILSYEFKLPIQVEPELRERYYGILEGKKGSIVKKELLELFKKRISLSLEDRMKFKFSNDYESDEEVLKRYIPTIKQIALANIGKIILIVGHVTTIKLLLISCGTGGHIDFEGQAIANSGYIEIQSDGSEVSVFRIVGRQKDDFLNSNQD